MLRCPHLTLNPMLKSFVFELNVLESQNTGRIVGGNDFCSFRDHLHCLIDSRSKNVTGCGTGAESLKTDKCWILRRFDPRSGCNTIKVNHELRWLRQKVKPTGVLQIIRTPRRSSSLNLLDPPVKDSHSRVNQCEPNHKSKVPFRLSTI